MTLLQWHCSVEIWKRATQHPPTDGMKRRVGLHWHLVESVWTCSDVIHSRDWSPSLHQLRLTAFRFTSEDWSEVRSCKTFNSELLPTSGVALHGRRVNRRWDRDRLKVTRGCDERQVCRDRYSSLCFYPPWRSLIKDVKMSCRCETLWLKQ